MKKLFLLFILLTCFFGQAQYTAIPDANFEKALIDLGIDSGAVDGKVLTVNISIITKLDIQKKAIQDLTGIEAFLSLENLQCSGNNLTTLDLSKNTALTDLYISYNKLRFLDVSKNLNLTELNCSGNMLSSLDFSKNTKLTYINCDANQLNNLNVSNNLTLTDLNCNQNNLNLLNISNNLALKNLACSYNQLKSLDISKNTDLYSFYCTFNKLTNINTLNNPNLNILVCYDNQLTGLDVSKNPNLNLFSCANNQLTNLDITQNKALTTLDCNDNQITTLDITNNAYFTSINCHNNQLTSLNLKNGNNNLFVFVNTWSNPNLTCIQVDNAAYSNTNWLPSRKDATATYSETCNAVVTNEPPIVTASGNQIYCPKTFQKIVSTFDIVDPDDTSAEAFYVQISSGYVNAQDLLTLANPALHPTIKTVWDSSAGKLTLSSPTVGTAVPYIDFIAAIKDIEFYNSSATPSGTRNFSITLGEANYLPSTGHYYQFVSNVGVTWTTAKALAEASEYYGLKGYLATLLSADEAKLSGEQASGAGWIGGSDAAKEDEWRWVTGPEGLANGGTGIVFWNGRGNGSTPNFAHWNTMNNEPNQSGDEDYAHITAPGVGIAGSWNDLSNTGNLTPGNSYQPKGYIVEYGGMPGDPTLHISASTTITIPKITSITPNSRCDSGSVNLQATATDGDVNWYTSRNGGTPIATGTTFTTPPITTTTTYFVDATTIGCTNSIRTAITATINTIPMVTSTSPASRCASGSVTLGATPSAGTINWYSQINGTVVGTGLSYTTPTISENTTYYAEATNNNCTNNIKVPVQVIVYPLPAVTDETIKKCGSEQALLDASIPSMKYLWNTNETSQTINVPTTGVYTVYVTSPDPENCINKKTITVVENNAPKIKHVTVDETTITIELVKNENYFEFSIDGVNFQSSNVFTNAPSGLQTAYVRDTNKCNKDNKPFIVIIVPKFFTPNNDNHNDVWEVKGLADYPLVEVILFDRYGKIITKLNSSNLSWDGTLNANPLPATDYWYVLKLNPNSPELKGHLTLKR